MNRSARTGLSVARFSVAAVQAHLTLNRESRQVPRAGAKLLGAFLHRTKTSQGASRTCSPVLRAEAC